MEKKLVATILVVSMLFGNSLWQIDVFANLNNVANGIEEMHETQEVEETKETQEVEALEKMEESQVFDDLEIEVPSNNEVNESTDLKNDNNNESKVLSTSDDASDETIYIEELESEIVSEDEKSLNLMENWKMKLSLNLMGI